MHPPKPLSLALALALGGTASAAQGNPGDPGDPLTVGNPADRVYTHTLITKATTSAVTGEVTNDLFRDVVAIMDGKVELIVSPFYANVQLELPLPAGHSSATACTTHYIESTRHEDVVAATDQGLARWVRDSATGDYSVVAISGTSNWANATQLMIANVYPGSAVELVGLFHDANGDTVVRAAALDAAGLTDLAYGALPTEAISIHAINRDAASPRDEVAVLFPSATWYLRGAGGFLNAFAVDFYTDDAQCAATISDGNGEGLAVVHETAAANYELGIYRTSGIPEARVSLGNKQIREIAAGQTTGNDDIDLVTVSSVVEVWRNSTAQGGASFTPISTYPTAEFGTAVGNGLLVGLALTDFDNDGDADIYVESERTGYHAGIAHVNPRVSQFSTSPLIQLPPAGEDGDETNHVTLQRGPTGGTGSVAMHLYNMTGVSGAGMTHLLVELWMPGRQPTLERTILPIPTSAPSRDFEMVFPTAGLDFFSNRDATFICRGVTLDAQGVPLTSGPAMRYGFSMGAFYTALRTNTIGEDDPPEDPPTPGDGRGGAPGSGSPPGF